jgi:hypothetical protein
MVIKKEILMLMRLGNIKSAVLLPVRSNDAEAFVLELTLENGTTEVMCTEKKQIREFKSLDSAYKMLGDLGLTSVELKTRAA